MGTRVATIEFRNGTGVPSNSLGANGDLYLDAATGFLYKKAAGAYTHIATLAGTPGAAGSKIYNGNGAPDNTLGLNGDYYLDNATGNLYFKASGAWGVNAALTGAPGMAGTVIRNGTGVPDNSLGVNGDYYLDTASGHFYYKSEGAYADILTLGGGGGGSTLLNGTGVPGSGTGANGNYFLATDTGIIYLKALGAWGALYTPPAPGISQVYADTHYDALGAASTAAGVSLPLSGGTMAGAIDMDGFKITDLGTPTADTDAATKAYADSLGGGGGSVGAFLHGSGTTALVAPTLTNLVPTMTSNTAPSGTCLSFGNSGSGPAWQAFDGNPVSYWNVNTGGGGTGGNLAAVGYTFTAPTEIGGCAITSRATDESPINFTIEGSNDAFVTLGDIVALKTVTGETWSGSERKEYTFPPGTFTSFRVRGETSHVEIMYLIAVEFCSTAGYGNNGDQYRDDDTGIIYTNSGGTWSVAYDPTAEFAAVGAGATPTTNSGTVANSATLTITHASDPEPRKRVATAYQSYSSAPTTLTPDSHDIGGGGGFEDSGQTWLGQSGGVWTLTDAFTVAAVVNQIVIQTDAERARDPKTWTIRGSNDGGSTWTTLDTQTNVAAWTDGETRTYNFANSTAYTSYQWHITANFGDGTYVHFNAVTLKHVDDGVDTFVPIVNPGGSGGVVISCASDTTTVFTNVSGGTLILTGVVSL